MYYSIFTRDSSVFASLFCVDELPFTYLGADSKLIY